MAIIPSDGSPADVAAKIAIAVNGDTVTIPSGSFAWTSGVSVSGKAISIQGAGSGRIITRSATTVAIGTGTKTFTVSDSGLSISNGQVLRIERVGSISNWMQGTVTSYTGTTLVMDITSTGGSGSQILWIISTAPLTTITHNAGSSTLFSLHADPAGYVIFSGVQFITGTGTGDDISILRTFGGKTVIIHDSWFRSKSTSGNMILTNTNQGLVYNTSFDSSPFSLAPLAIHLKINSNIGSWTTPSTMGMDDTTGTNNFYVEDCDFHAWLTASDADDNVRIVWRHCLLNNAGVGTHGADTSNYGVRHSEFYSNNCVFNGYSNGQTFNLNRWFFGRGGTGVIADNVMPHISSGDYGSKSDLTFILIQLQRSAGPNGGWGVINTSSRPQGWGYPCPRQPGFGYVTGSQQIPAWVSGAEYPGPGATWDGNLVRYSGVVYRSTVANSSTTPPNLNVSQWVSTGYSIGNDSITYIGDSEPWWIWGNTGSPHLGITNYGANQVNSVSTTAVPVTTDVSASYFQINRDYFFDSGAKPGWVPYTYPHPLASPITPTFVSASIDSSGTQLTLNLSVSCSNGVNGANAGLSISATGGAASLLYSSGSPGNAYIYSISRPILGTETVTITYVQPGDGIESTSAGIDLASFATQPVTNGSLVGAPVITLNPVSQNVPSGSTVIFTASSTGSPTPTWQWKKNGSNIGGATLSTLTLTNVNSGHNGGYSATATNTSGSANTTTANLKVSKKKSLPLAKAKRTIL